MANPEHVAAARRGPEGFRRWLQEHAGERIDLSGADLAGVDLSRANLGGALLDGVVLRGATLREIRFNSASIRHADLRGADVTGASFHRADLTGSDLRGVIGDTFGVGPQRLCVSPQSFDGVRWSRQQLEAILEMINLNPDWEVLYQLRPRRPESGASP